MLKKILYSKPSISSLEIKYLLDAGINGWGVNCYDYIKRFENGFKNYLGSKFSIATSSCTGALHIGMSALGIGRNDEVIISDTNWISAPSCVLHLGAKPIFVDILPNTWCIDPEKVEKSISSKTKVIVATHIYGNLCDMKKLLKIGKKYGIPVIEDAAEALGSTYYKKKAGSIGKFGVFSFHGTKSLTTGEGGMFVTNDRNLYERALTLSNHGRSRNQKKYLFPEVNGFKFKMSNIQAAIGLAQLKRNKKLIKRKKNILNYYKKKLCNLQDISMNPEIKHEVNGAWMPVVVFSSEIGIKLKKFLKFFSDANIEMRPFFYPVSSLPAFKKYKAKNYHAYDIAKRAINLPSYHDMTKSDQDTVISVVKKIINVSKK